MTDLPALREAGKPVVCSHCKRPKSEHHAANYSDGNLISGAVVSEFHLGRQTTAEESEDAMTLKQARAMAGTTTWASHARAQVDAALATVAQALDTTEADLAALKALVQNIAAWSRGLAPLSEAARSVVGPTEAALAAERIEVAHLREAVQVFEKAWRFEGPHRGVGVGVDRVAAIPVEPGALVRVVELSEHTDSDGSRGLLRSGS